MRYTKASHHVFTDTTFVCALCKHRTHVGVFASGVGRADILSPADAAGKRAVSDADYNVRLTLGAARCPSCGRRDPRGVFKWWRFHLLPTFMFLTCAIGVIAIPWFTEIDTSSDEWRIVARYASAVLVAAAVVALAVFTLPRRLALDRRIAWLDAEDD